MLKRVVIGAALACLMGGAAYAVDETQPENAPAVQEPMEGAGAAGEPADGDDECSQQLAKAVVKLCQRSTQSGDANGMIQSNVITGSGPSMNVAINHGAVTQSGQIINPPPKASGKR